MNLVTLTLMLGFELKIKGFTKNGFKNVTLISLLIFKILMFINFAFVKASSSTRVLLQTFEDFIRGVIFFLVAMYFLKRSSRILNDKKKWTKLTNWFILIVLVLFVVIEIVCAVSVYSNDVNDYTACLGWTDLFL